MTPAIRRLTLTTHIASSVGWFGAVTSFLALAIVGLASRDGEVVRAAYVAMELTTWAVIVPFCLASLLTGVIESLVTPWGLFRHYWVVTKLGLTLLATVLLLVHTHPVEYVAALASTRSLVPTDLAHTRIQLIVDAAAAILALVVATSLSVYKPVGLTRHGRRAAGLPLELESGPPPSAVWKWLWYAGLVTAFALFAFMHLGGGMHHH